MMIQCSNRYELNPCPETHPFAYYSGNYCCETNKEKLLDEHGALCDGGKIGIDSLCCEDNKYTSCFNPPCRDYQS